MKIRPSKHSLNLLLTGVLAAMLLVAVACGRDGGEPQASSIESSAATTEATEIPTVSSITNEPQITTTVPVTTTAPATTTTEPVTTTEAPVTTTEAPVTTTEAPATTTEAPVITTTALVTTTEAPETATKAPETATKAPATTTTAPVTTTEAPETATKAPVTTTTAPETATKAPETATKAPETATKAPATTTTAPVTTTKAPATTTKAPETTKTPTPAAPIPENAILNAAIQAAADEYGAIGIQVAVISDGQVSAAGQYGWATLNETPMAQDTKLRIASLSKTIVGMVTFRLVDEGKLSLDTDISDYLGFTVQNPYYPDTAITLRMLLSHTSSIVDLTAVSSMAELKTTLSYKSAYTNVKPGTKSAYSYNNFAFGLIGTICEAVTDDSLSDLAQAYFFKPMGIEASWIASDLPKDKLANVYRNGGSVGLSIATQLKNTDATAPAEAMRLYAGSLTISAVDYAKMLTLLMNDGCYNGTRYLSSESVKAMKTAQVAKTSYSDQCMPVMRCDSLYWQESLYYHTGSAYGVYALYTFDDTTGMGVVVVTTGARNATDAYGMYAICGDISGKVYKNKSSF